MTVERQAKLPTPKPIGKSEQLPTPTEPPLVSEDSIANTVPVAEKLAEGKKPAPEEISKLVASVAADLKAQGIALSSDDIRAIEQRAKEGLSPISSSPKPPPETKKPFRLTEMPEINLNEYQLVLDDFAKNYGLNKGAWNKISSIMVTSDLAGQALGGFYRKKFQTNEGFENLQDVFRDQISRRILHLNKITLKDFGAQLLKKETWKQHGGEIGKLIWQAAWPIPVNVVYGFMDRQGQKIASKMFLSERAKLQEQVNNRIADSLYMRNFEFLHDKSAAEMLEVINRGKDATVDLVSAIYEGLIPLKWSQLISVGAQGIVNPWDLAAAALKASVLQTRLKPNARRIQLQRAEELAQWDKVNTKLMTTLTGLETVRTAGNAEEGSDVLFQSLAQRDYVEQGGMREKRMQDRAINRMFDFLDISVPFVTEAWGVHRDIKNDPDIKAEKVFGNVIQGWFRIQSSKAEQQILRQSFLQLTHLYTDRIIPDIQDIKRMEELLGPYYALDHPMGLKERARVPVTSLPNFDISIKDLRFKHILRGVNLDIPQGSFVTIKGPSGIGKSTLFRHLVGLYTGESGTVSYGGAQIDNIKKFGDASLYSRIAYANQNPQYFEDMTLRENLLLWTKKDIPNEKIEAVLRDLKLESVLDRLDTKTKHFSGGELRRIGIARALLKDPKVLFLDEPTANLDAASTLQVMNIITELRRKRPDMTVVAITHDPVFEKIAEKIVDFEEINPKATTPTLRDGQVFEAKARSLAK